MASFEEKLDLVREHVSIYDLFDAAPHRVHYETRGIPCQISCPFHGRDLHKSTRVYPDSNSFYCWFCDKSWDVVAFWAQANEMWNDNGSLSYGKAVNDLMVKFNLRTVRPDWSKKLSASVRKLKEQRAGYADLPMSERERLKNFYAHRLARLSIEGEPARRKELWPELVTLWDALDTISLSDAQWKVNLSAWDEQARKYVESVK